MAAYQAPLSLGFSRQEHWSGLPFPSPMQESVSQTKDSGHLAASEPCPPWRLWQTVVALCIHVSQETGKVVGYSHLFRNFPQFVVIHTVKGFTVVNEAEVDVLILSDSTVII